MLQDHGIKDSATQTRASAADHFDSIEPIFAERRLRSRSAFQEGRGTEEPTLHEPNHTDPFQANRNYCKPNPICDFNPACFVR